MTPMERTIQSNLLRHAAGTRMFCPCCTKCLDWPTTVMVELRRRVGMAPVEATLVLCGACYDKREDAIRDICAEAGFLMEVVRKEPRPRREEPKPVEPRAAV